MPSSVSASPAKTKTLPSSPLVFCSMASASAQEKPWPDEPVEASAKGYFDSTCPLGPSQRLNLSRQTGKSKPKISLSALAPPRSIALYINANIAWCKGVQCPADQ